jgi:hypothetical protein
LIALPLLHHVSDRGAGRKATHSQNTFLVVFDMSHKLLFKTARYMVRPCRYVLYIIDKTSKKSGRATYMI